MLECIGPVKKFLVSLIVSLQLRWGIDSEPGGCSARAEIPHVCDA